MGKEPRLGGIYAKMGTEPRIGGIHGIMGIISQEEVVSTLE